jgi:hypothetical protein
MVSHTRNGRPETVVVRDMSPVPPVPFERLTALSMVVDRQLRGRGQDARATVFSLCIEAISFGREGDASDVGLRTRSAAHLLLELSCPELDDDALTELSHACERAAAGH